MSSNDPGLNHAFQRDRYAVVDENTPGAPYLTCDQSQIHAATNYAWSGDPQYALAFADERSAQQFCASFLRQFPTATVKKIHG